MEQVIEQQLDRVLERAAVYLGVVSRPPLSARPGARALAEAIERDIENVRASRGSTDRDTVMRSLMFESLDARLADYAGGFDLDAEPEPRSSYVALVRAIIDAKALLPPP